MKRGILVILLVLSLIGSVRAISSNIKPEYERGETIIAELFGNIAEPINARDVEFKRGHVAVPFDYGLEKLGDKYYLWAIAPNNANNYTIEIKKFNFEKNFSVTGNLTDYSIKPGAIYVTSDFEINVKLNGDFEKTINANGKDIVLKSGDNKISFSISEFDPYNNGLRNISIGKYTLYAYVIRTIKDIEPTLRINPKAIIGTAFADKNINYPFIIVNYGENKIEDIVIKYNKSIINLSSDKIDIAPKTAVTINISFIGLTKEIKNKGIDEIIRIDTKSPLSLELPIKISFTTNQSEVKTPYLEEKNLLYYCSELNGLVCTANEICDGKTEASIDGACCIGECAMPDKEGVYSWIGYVIAGVVAIILIYVFLRYWKASKIKDGFARRVEEAESKL